MFGKFVASHLEKKKEETKVSEDTKQKIKLAQASAATAVQMSGAALDMMQVMTKSMAEAMVEGIESSEYYKNYKSNHKKKDPPSAMSTQVCNTFNTNALAHTFVVDWRIIVARAVAWLPNVLMFLLCWCGFLCQHEYFQRKFAIVLLPEVLFLNNNHHRFGNIILGFFL